MGRRTGLDLWILERNLVREGINWCLQASYMLLGSSFMLQLLFALVEIRLPCVELLLVRL